MKAFLGRMITHYWSGPKEQTQDDEEVEQEEEDGDDSEANESEAYVSTSDDEEGAEGCDEVDESHSEETFETQSIAESHRISGVYQQRKAESRGSDNDFFRDSVMSRNSRSSTQASIDDGSLQDIEQDKENNLQISEMAALNEEITHDMNFRRQTSSETVSSKDEKGRPARTSVKPRTSSAARRSIRHPSRRFPTTGLTEHVKGLADELAYGDTAVRNSFPFRDVTNSEDGNNNLPEDSSRPANVGRSCQKSRCHFRFSTAVHSGSLRTDHLDEFAEMDAAGDRENVSPIATSFASSQPLGDRASVQAAFPTSSGAPQENFGAGGFFTFARAELEMPTSVSRDYTQHLVNAGSAEDETQTFGAGSTGHLNVLENDDKMDKVHGDDMQHRGNAGSAEAEIQTARSTGNLKVLENEGKMDEVHEDDAPHREDAGSTEVETQSPSTGYVNLLETEDESDEVEELLDALEEQEARVSDSDSEDATRSEGRPIQPDTKPSRRSNLHTAPASSKVGHRSSFRTSGTGPTPLPLWDEPPRMPGRLSVPDNPTGSHASPVADDNTIPTRLSTSPGGSHTYLDAPFSNRDARSDSPASEDLRQPLILCSPPLTGGLARVQKQNSAETSSLGRAVLSSSTVTHCAVPSETPKLARWTGPCGPGTLEELEAGHHGRAASPFCESICSDGVRDLSRCFLTTASRDGSSDQGVTSSAPQLGNTGTHEFLGESQCFVGEEPVRLVQVSHTPARGSGASAEYSHDQESGSDADRDSDDEPRERWCPFGRRTPERLRQSGTEDALLEEARTPARVSGGLAIEYEDDEQLLEVEGQESELEGFEEPFEIEVSSHEPIRRMLSRLSVSRASGQSGAGQPDRLCYEEKVGQEEEDYEHEGDEKDLAEGVDGSGDEAGPPGPSLDEKPEISSLDAEPRPSRTSFLPTQRQESPRAMTEDRPDSDSDSDSDDDPVAFPDTGCRKSPLRRSSIQPLRRYSVRPSLTAAARETTLAEFPQEAISPPNSPGSTHRRASVQPPRRSSIQPLRRRTILPMEDSLVEGEEESDTPEGARVLSTQQLGRCSIGEGTRGELPATDRNSGANSFPARTSRRLTIHPDAVPEITRDEGCSESGSEVDLHEDFSEEAVRARSLSVLPIRRRLPARRMVLADETSDHEAEESPFRVPGDARPCFQNGSAAATGDQDFVSGGTASRPSARPSCLPIRRHTPARRMVPFAEDGSDSDSDQERLEPCRQDVGDDVVRRPDLVCRIEDVALEDPSSGHPPAPDSPTHLGRPSLPRLSVLPIHRHNPAKRMVVPVDSDSESDHDDGPAAATGEPAASPGEGWSSPVSLARPSVSRPSVLPLPRHTPARRMVVLRGDSDSDSGSEAGCTAGVGVPEATPNRPEQQRDVSGVTAGTCCPVPERSVEKTPMATATTLADLSRPRAVVIDLEGSRSDDDDGASHGREGNTVSIAGVALDRSPKPLFDPRNVSPDWRTRQAVAGPEPRRPGMRHRVLEARTPGRRPNAEPKTPSSTVQTPQYAIAARRHFKRFRDDLVTDVVEKFNREVCHGRLPSDLTITWNNHLTKTAGITRCKSRARGAQAGCVTEIELSEKVVDCEERLRTTLCHELCHAASFIIDHELRPPHGQAFQKWAKITERIFPGVKITVCHSYDIQYKWEYQCQACLAKFGRHSKSIDVSVTFCSCGGSLSLLPRLLADGTPAKPRTPAAFSVFIKENYSAVKTNLHLSTQKEVMRKLSEMWSSVKASKNASRTQETDLRMKALSFDDA